MFHHSPVGQLIVSAAVIDDMIALVVLSMLETIVGEITVVGILIPIISACLWLALGGYIAIFIAPKLISRFILLKFSDDHHDKIELATMFALLLVLLPATHYTKASYLMGSFLAGLPFCSSEGLHHIFVRQFKRLLQWLMRIFFSASIGFQVPIKDFGDPSVIWQGLVFCLALTGKIGVGFLVPNFTQGRRFTGNHLRDCLVTGFSMAAEGEFAFVIAVFGVDVGLIDPDLYASVVLAVLISTIIPPFCLRFTISYYNKKGEEAVCEAAEEEALRKHDLEAVPSSVAASAGDVALVSGIKNQTDVFLCIQTQSEAKWGLLIKIMELMGKKGLDVIDHRAWAPRGINTTLVNEIYARCRLKVKDDQTTQEALDELVADLQNSLERLIDQKGAKVKVQRWYPGVVEEITEEVNEKQYRNIRQRLLKEASTMLEMKQHIQTTATTAKTVEEIMGETVGDVEQAVLPAEEGGTTAAPADSQIVTGLPNVASPADSTTEIPRPRRRVRSKMRSTPVVGGGLFGETIEARSGREGDSRISSMSARKKQDDMDWEATRKTGVPAEITINGEVFHISVPRNTYRNLKKGYTAGQTDSRGVPLSGIEITAHDDAPVVQRLKGFVRNQPLSQIKEESERGDHMSEISEETSNV